MAVTPRCKLGTVAPYISAQGYLFPCCWIANEPHVSTLKEYLSDDIFQQLDITEHSIRTAQHSEAMRTIEGSWRDGTLQPCVQFCGKQFIEGEPIARDNHLVVDLLTMKTTEF